MLHINSFTLVYNVTNDKYRLTVFGLDPSHNAYSHIVVSSTVSSVLLDHFKGPADVNFGLGIPRESKKKNLDAHCTRKSTWRIFVK